MRVDADRNIRAKVDAEVIEKMQAKYLAFVSGLQSEIRKLGIIRVTLWS